MNNKNYVYTYLFTLIAGVLLIILHNRAQIFEAICIILGVGFLVLGILSLMSAIFISNKAKAAGVKRSPALIIVSAASFILGLLMVVVPTFFINYLVYAFGIILLLCGIIQLCNFMPRMSGLGFSRLFLIAPVLCMLAGILIFVIGAEKILNSLALMTGIVLAVYSINGFVGYFNRRKLAKIMAAKIDPTGAIIEVK